MVRRAVSSGKQARAVIILHRMKRLPPLIKPTLAHRCTRRTSTFRTPATGIRYLRSGVAQRWLRWRSPPARRHRDIVLSTLSADMESGLTYPWSCPTLWTPGDGEYLPRWSLPDGQALEAFAESCVSDTGNGSSGQ